jgi:rod shape determining protein RodA
VISYRWSKALDLPMLGATFAITAFSVVIIRSASGSHSFFSDYVLKQILAILLGAAALVALALSDYKTVIAASRRIYVANLLLLVAVMVIGSEHKGAQRWIPLGPFNLQPSELAKVAVILTLAAHLVNAGDRIRTVGGLARSFLHVAIPAGLIFKQPDLGTALVVLAIWFTMTYIAGAKPLHLFLWLMAGGILFALVWHAGSPNLRGRDIKAPLALLEQLEAGRDPVSAFLWDQMPPETQRELLSTEQSDAALRRPLADALNAIITAGPIYDRSRFANVKLRPDTRALTDDRLSDNDMVRLNRMLLEDAYPGKIRRAKQILKPYQKQRLISFINPEVDPRGSGYHVRQSRIAIGSGQLLGKGLYKGTQKQLHFVPEPHTDFIFAVVAEELGFVGSIALLALYYVLIMRAIRIARVCEDLLGQLLAGGVAGLFAFHVLVNIGMTIGLVPAVGVPLLLFSYGPSSLLSNLCAIGLLQSVHMRRMKLMF